MTDRLIIPPRNDREFTERFLARFEQFTEQPGFKLALRANLVGAPAPSTLEMGVHARIAYRAVRGHLDAGCTNYDPASKTIDALITAIRLRLEEIARGTRPARRDDE